jgi:hypothetical protein
MKTALLSIAAVALAASVQAQTTITFENPPYTSGNIAGQDTWATTGTTANNTVRTVAELQTALAASGLDTTAVVHGGDQAFIISGSGAGSTSTRAIPGIADFSTVTVDVYARPLTPRADIGAINLGNIFMTLNSATGTRIAAFRFGYDTTAGAHIDFAENTSAIWKSTGMAWQSNTWYKITFVIDYAAQQYDFFVNDTKLNTSPIGFYQGNVASTLGQILFFRGTSQAGMIVDDISISSTPPTQPPTPPAQLLASNPYGFKVRISDLTTSTPDTNSIVIKLDGATVTPTSIIQTGNIGAGDNTGVTVVSYDSPTPIMPSGTQHSVQIQYNAAGASPGDRTFNFTVSYPNGTLDRTHHYFAQFVGNTVKYSQPGAGRSGGLSDLAVDMGNLPANNAKVMAEEIDLLSAVRSAISSDTLSVSIWTKRRAFTNSSSAFWLNSPTAPVSGRAFQLHAPYWDTNLYFDTGGTVENTARLTTSLMSLGGIEYWDDWRHIVAIKNGGAKQVYIDGQLIANQDSGAADISGYNDINRIVMGGASPDNLAVNGLIDDFAMFSTALSEAEVASLFNGTEPTAVKPEGLIAWWDFNDYPTVVPTVIEDKVVIHYNGVLQSATTAAGPFVDVPNATNPYTNTVTPGSSMLFRAKR